jgi:hypothetical protein
MNKFLKGGAIFLAAFVIACIGVHTVFAQSNFVPLAPIPGLTKEGIVNSSSLATFFNNLYKYLIGLAAALAVIEIIWGGIEVATNKDNVSKITDAKGRIMQAIYGLLLVLSPVLVFSIINPSILNLSVQLPQLNTRPATTASNGTGQIISTQSSISGCSALKGAYFQSIQCSTRQGRDQFVQSCTNGNAKTFDPPHEGAGAIYSATCDLTSGPATGPFMFIDVSSSFNPTAILQPIATAPTNQANGTMALQFEKQCKSDGGLVCIGGSSIGTFLLTSSVPCTTVTSAESGSKCYNMRLLCRDPSLPTDGQSCGGGFSIIP